MPLQNRVQPDGRIVAIAARGRWTGNRGHLDFDGDALAGARRWSHPHWIICTLSHPRGHRRDPRPASGWTPLFFHDEAVALAAGHRPCGYCRREDYAAFRTAAGFTGADEMDRALHSARCTSSRDKVTFRAEASVLPEGTFLRHDGAHVILWNGAAHVFTGAGYGPAMAPPRGPVEVLTPAPGVRALARGYRVQVALP